MLTIRLEDLEDNALACLGQIPQGESAIVIDEENRPLAEVKPLAVDSRSAPRPLGLAKGDFVVPDDFDLPLPEEFMRPFVVR